MSGSKIDFVRQTLLYNMYNIQKIVYVYRMSNLEKSILCCSNIYRVGKLEYISYKKFNYGYFHVYEGYRKLLFIIK